MKSQIEKGIENNMGVKTKQQVVFISRKLWAGGAEKVLYYLARNLNPDLFEPVIIYMIWQDEIPVKYDETIAVYCLEKGDAGFVVESVPEDNKKLQTGLSKDTLITRFKKKAYKLLVLTLHKTDLKQHVKSFIQTTNENASTSNSASDAYDATALISISLGANMPDVLGIKRILGTLRKDAVLIPMQEEPTVRVWLSQIYASYKYISYLCAPESLHLPLIYPKKDRLLVENWLFANAERSADAVVVPNNWMHDDMTKEFGVDGKKVQILPNPVDCEMVLKKMSQPLPGDFPIPEGTTIFVQLARVDPQKNHMLLIEACKILKKKYSNFLVLVIGNGSEFEKIKKEITKSGLLKNIQMLGELSNPYPYLAIARALLLTSEFEASPLVLVDAMLCGAVPIATNCICGPSDMLGDNEYGLLVPPGNADAFADAMYRIITDDNLHQRLKENGKREAWQYDIKRVVKEWEELITKVAKQDKTKEGEL